MATIKKGNIVEVNGRYFTLCEAIYDSDFNETHVFCDYARVLVLQGEKRKTIGRCWVECEQVVANEIDGIQFMDYNNFKPKMVDGKGVVMKELPKEDSLDSEMEELLHKTFDRSFSKTPTNLLNKSRMGAEYAPFRDNMSRPSRNEMQRLTKSEIEKDSNDFIDKMIINRFGGYKELLFTKEDMERCFREARFHHDMVGWKHDSFEEYLIWRKREDEIDEIVKKV